MAAISSTMAMAAAATAAVAAGRAMKSLKPKTPFIPKDTSGEELARERARLEAEAAQASSSRLAQKNRARKSSSLLARDDAPVMLGQGAGKAVLGQ